jgi:hypothetical protein
MRMLAVNQLVSFIEDGRIERVLWIDIERRGYVLIDIASKSALPLYRSHAELEAMAGCKQLSFDAEDPFTYSTSEYAIDARHRTLRDKNWQKVSPLVVQQPCIFLAAQRGKIIACEIAKTGESHVTLYRLLRRYWQRGMARNAFLPDYAKCGGRGRDKAISDKPRGRRPRYSGVVVVNVDPNMRSIFRAAITRFYASTPVFDLAECYHAMLKTDFTDVAINPNNGRQELTLRIGAPSLRQFRYWYEKDNDIFSVMRRRRTPRVYDKDMRGLLGTSLEGVSSPGDRYQIDATIADIYLVSRYDRHRIVGRPVVYVVIDVFSHLITGVYVGFEGPSWVGAMEALSIAVLDKVDYCRRFGIEILPEEWPSVGMPVRLLGDRGEMAGRMVETFINNFNVEVENAAPYRADWKGLVEQQFRLLPARFKAYTPGYIQEDFQQRGGNDYRLDATLDIDQFTRVLLFCILAYNNSHVLKDYPLSPEMIRDGVRPVPAEMWEWGVPHGGGRLRIYPAEQVRISLLPFDEATVTSYGIRYFGCYYSCSLAIEEHWFDRARQRGTWKVKISYDPRCMDSLWLHGEPGQPHFIACFLTDRSRVHEGRSLWEIDQLRQEARALAAAARPYQTQQRVTLINQVETVVREAEAMAPVIFGVSDSERTGAIRDNRQAERRELQQRDALRAAEGTAQQEKVVSFPTALPADNYNLPDITEILRSFGEEEVDEL